MGPCKAALWGLLLLHLGTTACSGSPPKADAASDQFTAEIDAAETQADSSLTDDAGGDAPPVPCTLGTPGCLDEARLLVDTMRGPAPFLADGRQHYTLLRYNAPTSVGGKIFYVGNDGTALWLFGLDPKTAKIEQLARIRDIREPSAPPLQYPEVALHEVGDTLIVSVDKKLRWRSDGSIQGTHTLAEQASWNTAISADGYSHHKIVTAGRALFHFSNTMIRYDVDAETTRSYPTIAGSRHIGQWQLSGDELFVLANDDEVTRIDANGQLHPLGIEANDFTIAQLGPNAFLIRDVLGGGLWLSDGLTGSPTLIKSGFSARIHRSVFAHGARAFFVGGTKSSDVGVWVSDGTGAGTVQIAAESASEFFVTPNFFMAKGLVYFRSSRYWWRSDGTLTGTYALPIRFDELPGCPTPKGIVFPIEKTSIAGSPLGETQLWITNGTVAGSRVLVNTLTGKAASFVCGSDGDVAFLITQAEGSYRNTVANHLLWRTDGTAEGTASLAEFRDITGPLKRPNIAVVSGAAFWGGTKADDTEHHAVLWQADTKTQGVTLAHDGRDGTVGSVGWVETMALSDGTKRLIVASATGAYATASPSLVISLGGENGDGVEVLMGSHLFDFYAPAFEDARLQGPQAFIRAPRDAASPTGDAFFFTILRKEVFSSDGTKAHTALLPIHPETWVPPIYGSKKLYFSGTSAGSTEHRLRVLPLGGTAEDIVDLGPPVLAPDWNLPTYALDRDQLIYITKDNALWRSDGSAAHTRPVTIVPPKAFPNGAWPADIKLQALKIVTLGARRLISLYAFDPAKSTGQPYVFAMDRADDSASDVFTGTAVDMEVVGDWALFFSLGPPWATNGTPAGTVHLAPAFGSLNDGQYIRYLTSLPDNRAL
ncbi:MAG: hypothetical protein JRH20_25710, partial [Deltaproteobacteria bacterium]|nr:hypothetical protein [Deltaproteobacteria bacterium]